MQITFATVQKHITVSKNSPDLSIVQYFYSFMVHISKNRITYKMLLSLFFNICETNVKKLVLFPKETKKL